MTDGLRIGFLMDPLEHVRVDHDTSFLLMRAAQARGHEVQVFEQHQLGYDTDRAVAKMRKVTVRDVQGDHFTVLEERSRPIADLDAVFMRKEPPVDADFLHATQLMELHGGGKGPLLVNSARGLREANEKLFAHHLPHWMPRTMVSADIRQLRAFIEEVGRAVVKPVDGFAGRGIVSLRAGDDNTVPLLEMATLNGRTHTIAQAFLEKNTEGDKRILLLDGEPIGALLRVPRKGDLRANMAAGGEAVKATITPRELELIAELKPLLISRGLHFVGIDVIGERLTEVNVTSPTGAAEVDLLDGVDTGARVMDWLEAKLRSPR